MSLNDLMIIIIGTIALIPTYVIGVEIYHRAPLWADAFAHHFLARPDEVTATYIDRSAPVSSVYDDDGEADEADMSSNDEGDDPDEAVASPPLSLAKNLANPIATLQNSNKDGIAIAVLAKLVAAGKLGQTDAIKLGLEITPSSTSTRYKEARDALKAEVERLQAKPQYSPLTPEQEMRRAELGLDRL